MFPPDFARTIDAEKLADSTEPKGLALVEETIKDVMATLEVQVGILAGLNLESDGHIPPRALGSGDISSRLSQHYGRAHRVIVDTVKGLEKELQEFHSAVVDAKKIARDSDERAAEEIAALARMARDLRAVDDRSRYDHRAGAPMTDESTDQSR